MHQVIKLAQKLIRLPSISPNDGGCQKIIIERLQALKFNIEPMPFNETKNLWAYRGKGCTLALAGHTDIVPIGNLYNWKFPPFQGKIYNNKLYGRGATDMKGSLAAMVIATERFIAQNPNHQGKLAFLITSDEEGSGIDGTKKIIETLINRQEKIKYCLIGEPTSHKKVGDTIKNGRRGSLTAKIKIYGIQGHVAYPQFANNPIHIAILNILNKLLTTNWNSNNNTSSKTTIQITKIHSGIRSNIIPNLLTIECNFRFYNMSTEYNIRKTVNNIIKNNNIKHKIDWILSAKPYFSLPGKLTDITINSIKNYQNITPQIDIGGGTSDGRFISKIGAEVIELGTINKTIHQANEYIYIKDLTTLTNIYQKIIYDVLSQNY